MPWWGEQRVLWIEPERVFDHLEDSAYAFWANVPLVTRLQFMGVCIDGLLQEETTPDFDDAMEVLAWEGLAESFHQLPYPGSLLEQPAGLIEAFAVIRGARNQEQMREIVAREERLTGGRGGGLGQSGR